MLEWSAADSCRWSGKCIQGILETLFFKDARVQSEGRCFCVELQFLWTFFLFFTMLKQYLLEYVTKTPSLTPLVSRHASMNYLWTFSISEWVCWLFFWGNGLDVVSELFAFADSDIQKWYLWTVPKGTASLIPALISSCYSTPTNECLVFSWKLDLYSTLLLWTGQFSNQRAVSVDVIRAPPSESAHPKWNRQRKDCKNLLCFRKNRWLLLLLNSRRCHDEV